MTEYTPTTKDVRDGFAFYYGKEKDFLSEEWTETVTWAGAAFERWLAERDEETINRTLNYAAGVADQYASTEIVSAQLRKQITPKENT